jgi:hypothetical protein
VAIFTIFLFSGGGGGTDPSGGLYTPLDAGTAQEDEGVVGSVAGVLICAAIFLGLLIVLLLCLGKGKTKNKNLFIFLFCIFKKGKKNCWVVFCLNFNLMACLI